MNKITCDKCNGDGEMYPAKIGDWFKQWRNKVGLTQTEVCEKAGISSITQLSRFEHNSFPFSEARLRKLADVYRNTSEK